MQTLSFLRPSRKPWLLSLALIATPLLAQAQAQDPAAGAAMTEPQVRALLTEKGYTRMDDLDFEDGMWETDATSADGNRVDVRVNPANGDIKAKLAAAGYSKVHDVDFDDGMWKAEAERADGNDVEIHLDATTGAIVHVEND